MSGTFHLAEYEFRQPDDLSATYMELFHTPCGEFVVQADHGDNLALVVDTLAPHCCPEAGAT